MRVTDFNRLTAEREGGVENKSIAQVAEQFRVERELLLELLGIDLYALVRAAPPLGRVRGKFKAR